MKNGKKFYKKICLSLVMFLTLVASSADARIPNIVQKQEKAIVAVYVKGKGGKLISLESGFVVDKEGVIAVSCNIITKWLEGIENTIVVGAGGGASYSMRHVISDNCRNNFVLIKVEADELPKVTLAPAYKPNYGEGIVVISRSSGSEITLLDGKINNIRKKDGFFQVTVPITPERDGSPVLNSKGEVIGISALLPGKRQGQHIVIPAKYILKEIDKYRTLPSETVAHSARAIPPAPVPVPGASETPQKGEIQDIAEQEFMHGCSYEKSNMYREAIEAYKTALRINPDFTEAYISLGLLNYKIGNYSEAVDAYKHAVKIKPDTLSVYNKLGAAYILLGEYPMAIDAFKQSIRIDPDNSETHFNLGVAYVISGDKDGAIGVYITLKKLDIELANKLLDLIY